MKIKQRMVSFFVISLLALSAVSIAPIRLNSVKAQQPSASLLGVISDKGVDPDALGLYVYLNVTIGINVTAPGYFTIESTFITDSAPNYLLSSAQASGYLSAGEEQLTLAFYGPTINHAQLNPYSLGNLLLYAGNNTFGAPMDLLESPMPSLRLLHVYSYSEFDPVAVLTGKIYDKGIDIEGDGLFNYLQVGVEVNVTDAGAYTVYADLLSSYTIGTLYNSSTMNLPHGLQIVNFSFNGALIRFSRMNFSSIEEIYLQQANNERNGTALMPLDFLINAPLSTTYSYMEFQTLAYFTGTIKDKGIRNPGDSLFDYLEIDVQINVTEAGNYSITIAGLYGSTFNGSWVNYSDYRSGYFSLGLQFVNFTCPSQMIYASKANVALIGSIQLWAYMGEEGWWYVDQLPGAPLSRTYNYTEFNPHAYLTGRVYDFGVDTDHDGLFDYLQTNVEINVTEAGTYQVSVQGLAENDSSQIYDSQISNPLNLDKGIHLFNLTFYGPEIAYDGINPRTVTGVYLSELSNSSAFSGLLDSKQSVPLLTLYNSSEFDHPLNDMQLNFTVNPDGSIAINAMLNETHAYPQNPYDLVVNASVRLHKTNNRILGLASGTIGLPPYASVPWVGSWPNNQAQFPTNQTTADYLSQYNNGILTEKLNATSIFPPIVKTQYPYNTTDFALLGTFSNGMMHTRLSASSIIPQTLASELPFNVTDVTVEANLGSDNAFKGNVTLHIISGLPIGDIIINFEGNRSDMFFIGNITVPYGTYEGTVVNATYIAQLISEIKGNITGEGPSSLYSMTNGTLECTNIEITNTTITGGVRINYNASIQGDFAATIAKFINNVYFPYSYDQYYPAIYAALNATLSSVDDLSFTLAYAHAQKLAQMVISFDSNIKNLWSNALKLIPPTIPSNITQYATDEINTWLKLGNATAYAVQNAWLNVTYTHLDPTAQLPRLDLSTVFVENAAQLENDTRKLIPDLSYEYPYSPQLQNIVESYLNETYATLYSYNTTVHLQNGIATFRTDFAFNGNLDEQINAAKSYYVNLINYDYSLINATLPTQITLINQTSIDINNLSINLQYGKDNAFLNVTGIVVSPPIQSIGNFRAFKLTNFFNTTSLYGSNQPPAKFEKLKITIHGGSNSTYTVIPSSSGTVPTPSEISLDGQTFIWENTTISSLRDMVFNIAYQESYQNGGTTYGVPILSNSTISNFNFNSNNKTITFSVTGTPGTMGYCNITIPQSLLDISTQSSWVIMEDGKNLQPGNLPLQTGHYNATQNGKYTFIYLIYTHSNHTISIQGNISSVQEMQPNTIPLIMMIISLIATLLIVTQRKKIRSLKTKSLDIANRMSNRFSQLLKK